MKDRKPPRPEGTMQVRPASVKSGPSLNREIQTKIGQQLRAIYDDVVDQGVPDRFADLLRDIEQDKHVGSGERGDKDSPE
jgi:hypothetical protein